MHRPRHNSALLPTWLAVVTVAWASLLLIDVERRESFDSSVRSSVELQRATTLELDRPDRAPAADGSQRLIRLVNGQLEREHSRLVLRRSTTLRPTHSAGADERLTGRADVGRRSLQILFAVWVV